MIYIETYLDGFTLIKVNFAFLILTMIFIFHLLSDFSLSENEELTSVKKI